MKYLVSELHNPRYRIVDEVSGDVIHSQVIKMPVRPKRGQFWHDGRYGYVFISSIHKMAPGRDDEDTYRGVSIVRIDGRERQEYMGGYEMYAGNFLREYKHVDDRATIMKLLGQLIVMCPTMKKVQNILRLKELNLSEEEKGMILLSVV